MPRDYTAPINIARPDSEVTYLMEHAQLVRLECADDRVQQTPIMEENEITFLPILRVDELKVQSTWDFEARKCMVLTSGAIPGLWRRYSISRTSLRSVTSPPSG